MYTHLSLYIYIYRERDLSIYLSIYIDLYICIYIYIYIHTICLHNIHFYESQQTRSGSRRGRLRSSRHGGHDRLRHEIFNLLLFFFSLSLLTSKFSNIIFSLSLYIYIYIYILQNYLYIMFSVYTICDLSLSLYIYI